MKSFYRWVGAFLLINAVMQPHPVRALESYFINNEVMASNISMFPKWTGMLSRYNHDARPLESICGKNTYSPCKLKGWKTFLEGMKGKSVREQMDGVNRFINRYPYVEDIVNWGVQDYWETPYEFQRKNGDCEDYAISKFISLRALGVANDDMRVEIVQDLNLGGIIHAVLVVFESDNVYVLDNQIKQVMPALDIYHYKPIYSINETHWWRHLMVQ